MGIKERTIEKRIRHILEGDPSRDDVVLILEKLHSAQSDCERSIRRNFVYIVVLWAIACLISGGIINEGQIASFKVEKVKSLLIFFSPLIALLSYEYAVAATSIVLRMKAMNEIYKKFIPRLVNNNIEHLLMPTTFITHERFLSYVVSSSFNRFISKSWLITMELSISLGTLAVLIHVSYLLWIDSMCPWYTKAIAIFISVIIWLRAMTLYKLQGNLVES